MDKRKVIYYSDELNDEFSLAEITPREIGADYIYCHDTAFKAFTHFFWYRVVAMPIAFLYTKLRFSHRIVGGEKLGEYKKGGYFIYGNHTQDIGDAFIPNMLNKKRDKYVVVHPNNVSIPVIGRVTPSLGALPIPDDREAYRNFLDAIDRRISEGKAVVIYPEAHIWPYYTGIRPFGDTSFHYPAKSGAAVFCFTNTYMKRRFSKEPRIVTYVDGPFFPNEELPLRERRRELRNRVYETMRMRAELSDTVKIKYIKREKKDD
ncbi:MAG: hypothetical protein E7641_07455 [Ruminococcaceae bacterium]|nr:hypothetical protein [Oscillospiraceae bacterium]